MTDFIIAAILLLAVGGAATYIYRAKKRGQHCIGCPHAKICGSSHCGCDSQDKN